MQHLNTPVTTIQEMSERTIIVVNDDKDQEINTNIVVQHSAADQNQKVSIIFPFLSSNIPLPIIPSDINSIISFLPDGKMKS